MIISQGSRKNTSNARKLIFKGFKIMFYAILSEIWDLDGPYCTNLGYKFVVMVWKSNWMFLMLIRLDYYTRKLQKYVKCRDINILGGQNHVLYYFIRNMVFKWSILHCSWEQINYNCLENNLNGSQVRKAWSWHQEVAKYAKMQRNRPLGRSKSRFMLSYKKYWIKMAHVAPILGTFLL